MSVNKVILVGRLGQNPESRSFPDGGSICNISIATSENWKDRETGEKKEQTEWHRVVLRNRLGEIAQQYLSKGSQVYIEGRIHTRKWQDQNGNDRYSTEVVAREMRMLDSKSANTGDNNTYSAPDKQNTDSGQKPSSTDTNIESDGGDQGYLDDDIPF